MPREQQRPPTYGGMLRQARTTTGQEGQDTRVVGGRAAHTSRGSFVNYYDDLKISTTPEQARKVREEEAAFNTQVGELKGKIDSSRSTLDQQRTAAQSKIDAAASKIPDVPGYKEALSSAWSQTKKTFVPIRVVSNGKIEGTYMLPKEAAENLAKEKGITTSWANGGFNVDVRVQGGRIRGAELHKALGDATNSVYNKFVTSVTPKLTESIKSAKGQVSQAQGVLKGAQNQLNEQYTAASSEIATAQGALDAKTAARNMQWETIRDNYEKKKATIAQIFANMKVEGAK